MTPPDPNPTAPPTAAPATELKPCPFCGEIPTEIAATRSRAAEALCANMAANCIASRASGYVGQWNTRPIEDRLSARVAELEARNEILRKHKCLNCGSFTVSVFAEPEPARGSEKP